MKETLSIYPNIPSNLPYNTEDPYDVEDYCANEIMHILRGKEESHKIPSLPHYYSVPSFRKRRLTPIIEDRGLTVNFDAKQHGGKYIVYVKIKSNSEELYKLITECVECIKNSCEQNKLKSSSL